MSTSSHNAKFYCLFVNRMRFAPQRGKSLIINFDDMHLFYDFDHRNCLGKKGQVVFYRDVLIGGESIMFVRRLFGGENIRLAFPYFIYKNYVWNYPIKRTMDNMCICSYTTQHSGCMSGLFSSIF